MTSTFSGEAALPPAAKNRISGERAVMQIDGVVPDPPAGVDSDLLMTWNASLLLLMAAPPARTQDEELSSKLPPAASQYWLPSAQGTTGVFNEPEQPPDARAPSPHLPMCTRPIPSTL